MLAARVKDIRERKGWSAQRLADRCEELGAEYLNRSVIANIESGRKKNVTLEQAFILAFALGVAPIFLMVPIDNGEDLMEAMQIAPHAMYEPGVVRDWARGYLPIEQSGPDYIYRLETPEGSALDEAQSWAGELRASTIAMSEATEALNKVAAVQKENNAAINAKLEELQRQLRALDGKSE